MKELAMRLWREDEGQALLEYTLLLVLVTLAAVSSMRNVASTVGNIYSDATSDITGSYAPTVRTDGGQLDGSQQSGTSSQFGWGMQGKKQDDMNNNAINNTLK